MKNSLSCLLLLLLLLCGCSFPTELFFEPPPLPEPGSGKTVTPLPTHTLAPSFTPQTPTESPCAFAWATRALPDETAVFQEVLKKAGLDQVEVTLSAYGENCLDISSKKVVRFAAMQTDFYFNVPVRDLNDADEKGNWAARILALVRDFPAETLPGPNRGLCGMTYQTLGDSSTLTFSLDTGLRALEAGQTGEALFTLLARR